MKILVVEDNLKIRENIIDFFKIQGHLAEGAENGYDALTMLHAMYDIVILDINMPKMNGKEFLEKMRTTEKNVPVIALTSNSTIENKAEIFELGADDYLTKPFHLLELNARIKGLIRRKTAHGAMEIKLGNVSLVPDRFEVAVKGHPLELKRKEYDILYHLMTRPNRLVDKAALAEAVWGDYIDQADNYDFVYAQIKNLRKQMNDAGATIEIKSVYGFGYKLIEREEDT